MNIRTLLIACLALRLILVFFGGQHFFPDETRYDWTLEMVQRGQSVMIAHPEHPGFHILMLPAAALQTGVAHMLGIPKDLLNWMPATVNVVFSVIVIALIYGIALRSTKQQSIALLAAGFAASSAPLLYFCRHLVPYDAAIAFALVAVYLALDPVPAWHRGFLGALSIGFSSMIYHGNVLLVVTVLLLTAWFLRQQRRNLLIFAATVFVPPACLLLVGGARYWEFLRSFYSVATQGWLADGPFIPWLYLWSADHAMFLVFVIGLIASFRSSARMSAWATLALYSLMVLASYGFGKWAIYGRTARTLLPFLCIAAAGGWHMIFREWDRIPHGRAIWIRYALVNGALLQVIYNFAPIMTQRFPTEINREISRFSTFSTGISVGRCLPLPSAPPKSAPLILMNSIYLWPVECFATEPQGRIVYQTRHPFQYDPYLYESFTPQQRSLLRRADISIRLLQP